MQSVIKTSLVEVFLGSGSLGTDGGLEVKTERLPELDEDEKLLNYFSSDKRNWEAFEVVDFEPGGVIRSLSARDVASDKRLDVTSGISSAVPLRLFCRKEATVDFESLRSWLVW